MHFLSGPTTFSFLEELSHYSEEVKGISGSALHFGQKISKLKNSSAFIFMCGFKCAFGALKLHISTGLSYLKYNYDLHFKALKY